MRWQRLQEGAGVVQLYHTPDMFEPGSNPARARLTMSGNCHCQQAGEGKQRLSAGVEHGAAAREAGRLLRAGKVRVIARLQAHPVSLLDWLGGRRPPAGARPACGPLACRARPGAPQCPPHSRPARGGAPPPVCPATAAAARWRGKPARALTSAGTRSTRTWLPRTCARTACATDLRGRGRWQPPVSN